MTATVSAQLAATAAQLAEAGIEAARLEARLLLAHALGCDQETLLLRRDEPVAAPALAALLARRRAREPLARILGRREFWGFSLALAPATLIPRPDSETVIAASLAVLPRRDEVKRVLDLGTGSGCLLLAALREFPAAFGLGVDRAASACRCAARNAAALGLAGRAAFLCADWGTAIAGRFDLVLCNPPYIASAEIATLEPEVARFDPPLALDGGADGLAAYRAVLAALPALLAPAGVAVLELGQGQLAAVSGLADAAGLCAITARADLAGIPRALVLGAAGAPSTRAVATMPQPL